MISYPERTIPVDGLASEKRLWETLFDTTKKIVVYRQTDPNEVDVIGYYESVSLANAAAVANYDLGSYPRISVNWAHPDFTKINVGAYIHRDATASMPAWFDEAPEF